MGYTHYWKFSNRVNKRNYNKAVKECRLIIAQSPVPLAGSCGVAGTEPALDVGVYFNGVAGDSHESFALGDDSIREHCNPKCAGFNFCTTANKPYDLIVTACLCVLKERVKTGVHVSSDGDRVDWKAGCAFASEILGREVPNPIKD